MNNLRLQEENKTMTSKDVAEVTGKRHDNIMRDIRSMSQEMKELSSSLNFEESNYTDKRGKIQPIYNLNEDQYLLLATKYSAKMRMQLIKAWREAEDIIKDGIETNEFLIEDNFIKNYNAGKNKIIINFFRRILENKGIDTFIQSIEYTLSKVNRDRKEKLLEDFRITYSKLINEQDGSFGADNAIQINSTKAVIEAKNREFSRRSAAHVATSKDKAYKRLRVAKDGVTNAYLNVIPKTYTGKFTITGVNDYYVNDENLDLAISPTSFTKNGEVIEYMSGLLKIKDNNLFLTVTGGIDGNLFSSKHRNLDVATYQGLISLDMETLTYIVKIIKLKV